MMKKLKELMMKKAKEGKFVSEDEQKIKGGLLDAIGSIMSEGGAEKLKGLKKVTVASDSPEGLKEGLKKAEDVVENKMEDEDEDEEEESEMEESCPMKSENSMPSKEEKIALLKQQLAELESE